MSRFGKTNLIIVDHWVKINDTYYHDVLLTAELLPVMLEISGEFLSVSLYVSKRGAY